MKKITKIPSELQFETGHLYVVPRKLSLYREPFLDILKSDLIIIIDPETPFFILNNENYLKLYELEDDLLFFELTLWKTILVNNVVGWASFLIENCITYNYRSSMGMARWASEASILFPALVPPRKIT